AFKGETAADTMTAILTKEPADLDAARLAISPSVERIIRRCLEKSPDLRFQSANDLAFALETLSTVSTSTTVPPDPVAPVHRRGLAWLPWAIAAAGLLAAAVSLMLNRTAPPEARWAAFTRITEAAGEETAPT